MKSTIYCNRENIALIHRLKKAMPGLIRQTNSRYNGAFATIRVYDPDVKQGRHGTPSAVITSPDQLRRAVAIAEC